MPVRVSGRVVEKLPGSVPDWMEAYPRFKSHSAALCSQHVRAVGPEGLLYVGQREMAITTPADGVIHILGTEDATTCHIVILRHTGSRATCLSHFDGCGTEKAVKDMITLTEELSSDSKEGRLELHVVGGFLDDKGSSEELSNDILGTFHKFPQDIYLMTACITHMNNVKKNQQSWPVIYGMGVDVLSGELFPATFPDKGPDQAIRSARHFTGGHEVLNIYDPKQHHLRIGPFTYESMRDIDKWCTVPDRLIRRYLSTSPDQEPPHFEASVRAALLQIRDFPNPMNSVFTDGKARKYKKQGDGSWMKI